MARSECEVVKAGLQEQVDIQTGAVTTLRQRVTELEGMKGKWEAEQERVKVCHLDCSFQFLIFASLLPSPVTYHPPPPPPPPSSLSHPSIPQ